MVKGVFHCRGLCCKMVDSLDPTIYGWITINSLALSPRNHMIVTLDCISGTYSIFHPERARYIIIFKMLFSFCSPISYPMVTTYGYFIWFISPQKISWGGLDSKLGLSVISQVADEKRRFNPFLLATLKLPWYDVDFVLLTRKFTRTLLCTHESI